jgi:uncharacterized protein YaeQ
MAIGASIYKVNVNLSNLNTHYYEDFDLTLAKHPSENESRMMFRLVAFLFCAHKDLEFTRGLSSTDEPELWQRDYTGDIIQWIELGLPDSKRLKQACGKSKNVKVFTYHQNKSEEWYKKIKDDFISNNKLDIYHLNIVENGPLEKITQKSMKLSCLIEEQLMYLGDDNQRVGIEFLPTNERLSE